jgi:hypothetical protein
MSNSKWYLLCDLQTFTALDLMQIPSVWRNVTGMEDMSDSDLARIGEWSQNHNLAFLSVEAAISKSITVSSIQKVLLASAGIAQVWLRSMRDPLLLATDIFTTGDRWKSFDSVSQNNIARYRQALRDVTHQDPLEAVWPYIPLELDSIRSLDTSLINRPSAEFLDRLKKPTPEQTIEEIQRNQWTRLKDERDTRKAGGLMLVIDEKEYWFHTDESSRGQYSILSDSARRNNLPENYVLDQWKTMSGEFLPLTIAILHLIMDTGIHNESVLFNITEKKLLEMKASPDPINYPVKVGWPQTYEEWVTHQS